MKPTMIDSLSTPDALSPETTAAPAMPAQEHSPGHVGPVIPQDAQPSALHSAPQSLDGLTPVSHSTSRSRRRYAAVRQRKVADALLSELTAAAQVCLAAGGDCSSIRVCFGEVCAQLGLSAPSAPNLPEGESDHPT